MASISFYLDRASDPKSKEVKSIFINCTWKSKRLRYFSGIKVKECDWVPSIERLNPKLTGASQINNDLQIIEDRFKGLFDNNYYNPLPAQLKIDLAQKQAAGFFDLYDRFLIESASRVNTKRGKIITSDVIRHYEAARDTIKRFDPLLSFDKINNDFYSRFRAFCLNDEGLSINTFGSKIRKLKTFLYWCQGLDIQISYKFWNFEVPGSYDEEAEPLEAEELLRLWSLELNESDQVKLDCLLALCSTGMRISDYNIVMTNMDKFIKVSQEGSAIIFNAQKTGVRCIVPFHDDIYFRPEYLHKKYSGKMPPLSSQKLNDWLKSSAIVDRIKVTSKTGRKTRLSIAHFVQGLEAQYVMKISGHLTETEFRKYLGVNPNSVIKASREKGTYLKGA